MRPSALPVLAVVAAALLGPVAIAAYFAFSGPLPIEQPGYHAR
jgi:hypothetical protein